MAAQTFTVSGTKATSSVSLPKSVFALSVENHQLLKDAYLAYTAGGRQNLAKTLKRGEVSGGGIKPWRQKGTGRARFGSSRNPIWRKGGVVFGPTGDENYSRKLSTAAKRQALAQALSLASDSKKVVVIEDFIVKDGKTKTVVNLLNKIGTPSRTVVVVTDKKTELVRAMANLSEVTLTTPSALSVFDVLNAKYIVFTKPSLPVIEERLTKTSKEGAK